MNKTWVAIIVGCLSAILTAGIMTVWIDRAYLDPKKDEKTGIELLDFGRSYYPCSGIITRLQFGFKDYRITGLGTFATVSDFGWDYPYEDYGLWVEHGCTNEIAEAEWEWAKDQGDRYLYEDNQQQEVTVEDFIDQ